MIVYILDKDFNRVDIISDYISLIWTDRWNTFGDFEIHLPTSPRYTKINPGTVLTMSESPTPMMIETVIRKEKELMFKGRSLEHIAQYIYFKTPFISRGSYERVAVDIFNRATLFDNHQVTFDRDLDLSIFSITLGTERLGKVVYETDDDSVFDQFKKILDINNSGYTLSSHKKDFASWNIRVDCLKTNDNVALSTSLNDFEYFENVKSITNYRNRAYVRYIQANGEEAYIQVSNSQFAGQVNLPWEYSSRMVLVDATNINREDYLSDVDHFLAVTAYGRAELSKYRFEHAFDGKLNPNMRYKYGRDYRLGDFIPVFNEDQKHLALVKEYIWSATTDSIEEYPTLEFSN